MLTAQIEGPGRDHLLIRRHTENGLIVGRLVLRLVQATGDSLDPAAMPEVVGGDLDLHFRIVPASVLEHFPDLDGTYSLGPVSSPPVLITTAQFRGS